MKKIVLLLSLVLSCATLISCAKDISPNTYSTSQVGVASTVKKGVLVSKRAVSIDNNSGAGGLVGVGAGAVGGSLIGGSPTAHILGALGGAVVGGIAGNAADKAINHHQGFEYIVKLSSGKIISVAQVDDLPLQPHQHVLVIYGTTTRIVPDEG